jgi:hypothetical protein
MPSSSALWWLPNATGALELHLPAADGAVGDLRLLLDGLLIASSLEQCFDAIALVLRICPAHSGALVKDDDKMQGCYLKTSGAQKLRPGTITIYLQTPYYSRSKSRGCADFEPKSILACAYAKARRNWQQLASPPPHESQHSFISSISVAFHISLTSLLNDGGLDISEILLPHISNLKIICGISMALRVIYLSTSADSSTYSTEILPLFELEIAILLASQRRHLSGICVYCNVWTCW